MRATMRTGRPMYTAVDDQLDAGAPGARQSEVQITRRHGPVLGLLQGGIRLGLRSGTWPFCTRTTGSSGP